MARIGSVLKNLLKNQETKEIVLGKIASMNDELIKAIVDFATLAPADTKSGFLSWSVVFGQRATPYIIDIIITSEDRFIRRLGMEMLKAQGNIAAPFIIKTLTDRDKPWYALRNMLDVIPQLNLKISKDILIDLLQHPHTKVKISAIRALAHLYLKESEVYIIPFLEDPDPEIRRKTLLALAKANSSNEKVIDYMCNILSKWRTSRINEDDLRVVIESVSLYSPARLLRRADFENILMDIAKPPNTIGRIMSSFLKDDSKRRKLRMLAIKALGSIASQKGIKVLQKLSECSDPHIASEATNVLRKKGLIL